MRKLTGRQQVESWLKTFGHLFNKNALERETSLSKGRLQKHLKYDKRLSNDEIKELKKLMQEFKSFFKKIEQPKKENRR